ncbi:MAG TPA: alpha amylase C-terminal domain-containing protein, partial [Spirochaetota bacterium]|nr:alpha amylase C-terminal domain-containing protein [Spirochaetota bacterium]
AEKSLDWHLLDFDFHKGLKQCVTDLNTIYKREKSMWEKDCQTDGFIGLNMGDSDNSIISFIRRSSDPFDFLVFLVNFTPVPRGNYRIGVPENCFYEEIFNSDAGKYCGGNVGNFGGVSAYEEASFGMPYSINVTVPPLGGVILKPKYK